MPKNILILGATGSIGLQTLSVIKSHPQKFAVYGLVANKNVRELEKLCQLYQPKYAVLTNEASAKELKAKLKTLNIKTKVLAGMNAVLDLIADEKVFGVMCAMVGAIGILPVYHAIAHNKTIYLANKESMVVAGEILTKKLRKSQAKLLPVDSEHNAIFQCLPFDYFETKTRQHRFSEINNLWLTASGGPFHNKFNELGNEHKIAKLAKVSVKEALAHPKWKMGAKISIDSATLMNKGLEVIEAHFLFAMPPEKIKVVVHPQSIIHSMVEYIDGSFIAQLSTPDMRTPIAQALAYPERISRPQDLAPMNPFTLSNFNFEKPNLQAFPCLQLAFSALKIGGNAPLVLNAANEITVQAFIDEKINFNDISRINANVLDKLASHKNHLQIDELIANDIEVRKYTEGLI